MPQLLRRVGNSFCDRWYLVSSIHWLGVPALTLGSWLLKPEKAPPLRAVLETWRGPGTEGPGAPCLARWMREASSGLRLSQQQRPKAGVRVSEAQGQAWSGQSGGGVGRDGRGPRA